MEPTLGTLVPSFQRHLLATNRSRRTVETYVNALAGLTRYLEAEGLPVEVRSIKRVHLESFVASRLATVKASTVSVQFRAGNDHGGRLPAVMSGCLRPGQALPGWVSLCAHELG